MSRAIRFASCPLARALPTPSLAAKGGPMPELLELPTPGKWKTVLTDSDLAVELAKLTPKLRHGHSVRSSGVEKGD